MPDKVDSSFEALIRTGCRWTFFFNVRAEKCYLKAGFKREGVLRDAVLNGDEYADDILMSILEDEWREIKIKEISADDISFFGAPGRIRTADLLITNQLLYRLSHGSRLKLF